MFGFIKDKLKKAVQLFTKATTKPEEPEEPKEELKKPIKKEIPVKGTKPEKKTEPKKTQKEVSKERVIEKPRAQEPRKEPAQVAKKEEPEPEKQEREKVGFFGKLKAAITTKKLSREEFDKLFEELELGLLENNAALEVVDKIKEDLWTGLSSERFSRFSPEKRVEEALKESLSGLFMEPFDILKAAKQKDLYIICAIGINGSGKTTTLAKLAQYFKDNKLTPVLAAADTFRAAAIHQLEEHANRIGVKIIKQQYGADAAAVAFDAVQYAKANKCRVVLIDTAGRLHSNTNLMEE